MRQKRAGTSCRNNKKQKCIVFTGGGTAGHVYPCEGIINRLRKPADITLYWIGSSRGMEKKIIKSWGIPFFGIPSGKLRRYFSLENLSDVFKICAGIIRSVFLMIHLKPDLIFSKGGYVSVPPVIAAWLTGVPVFTHESDFDPGLATRINSRFAERILVSYGETKTFFSPHFRTRILISGNPVRDFILRGNADEGRKFLGIGDNKPLLLVLGGSQGASEINRYVLENLDYLTEDFYVVHQMGPKEYRPLEHKDYHPVPFLHDEYADILAAADLVVGRSGASTVWEIAAAGKRAILVPLLTGASRGDQLKNARYFARFDGISVLDLSERSSEGFRSAVASMRVFQQPEMKSAAGDEDAPAVDKASDFIAGLIVRKIEARMEH